MINKIVVVNAEIALSLIQELQSIADVTWIKDPLCEKEELASALQSADAIICSGIRLGADELAHAKNLKVVSTISAGFDNFDVTYLKSKNIVLCNTPDTLTDATADLGFTLLMAAARRLPALGALIQEGRWTKNVPQSELYGMDVFGKTLGIIGFGRIGQAVARRGHFGFGMPILYHSTTRKPEAETIFNATFCSLASLLEQSDFVCVTVPLNAQTHHLIGAQELEVMKPHTILVNIARGAVIDEAALIHALKEKKIYSAGLDVFEQEPLPSTSELLSLPNVVITPHIGSATAETRMKMAQAAIDNAVAVLENRAPAHRVV